jgi:hypothetical protein
VRINEIASAEEQIELWKLVSNSVWQSLQQQQKVQQQRDAAAAAARKSAPKAKRGVRGARPIPSLPKVPTPKPPSPTPNKNSVPTANPTANPAAPIANKPVAPAALPTASVQPNAQQLAAQALPNSQLSVKTTGIAPKYVQKKTFDDTDDRHSKNTFSPPLPNTARR